MSDKLATQSLAKKSKSNSSFFIVVAFLCVGFLFTAVVMEHAFSVDTRYSNWERFKNHYLKTATDSETNVVILGNSKLFRGIDTPLLNKMSSESGCGLRFYNAGFPGMNAAEFLNNLDSIAANSNFNPNYVLFMPSVFRTQTNLLSQRRRNNALIRLWSTQMLNLHANDRAIRAYINLHLSMFQRAFNKSKLTRKWIANDVQQKVLLPTSLLVQSNSGYLSLDEDPSYGLDNRRHLKFENTPELYQTLRSKLELAMRSSTLDAPQKFVLPNGEALSFNASAKTLSSLFVDKIQSLGAKPVTLFFPLNSAFPERHYYKVEFPHVKQVAATVEQLSWFADKHLWYDHEHLKQAGADLFTGIVFQQMCQSVSD